MSSRSGGGSHSPSRRSRGVSRVRKRSSHEVGETDDVGSRVVVDDKLPRRKARRRNDDVSSKAALKGRSRAFARRTGSPVIRTSSSSSSSSSEKLQQRRRTRHSSSRRHEHDCDSEKTHSESDSDARSSRRRKGTQNQAQNNGRRKAKKKPSIKPKSKRGIAAASSSGLLTHGSSAASAVHRYADYAYVSNSDSEEADVVEVDYRRHVGAGRLRRVDRLPVVRRRVEHVVIADDNDSAEDNRPKRVAKRRPKARPTQKSHSPLADTSAMALSRRGTVAVDSSGITVTVTAAVKTEAEDVAAVISSDSEESPVKPLDTAEEVAADDEVDDAQQEVGASGSGGALAGGGSRASSLECPICFEAFSNAIYQCRNGHLICDECYPQVCYVCPQCKTKMDTEGIRNRALEQLIGISAVSKRKCTWRVFGCSFHYASKTKSASATAKKKKSSLKPATHRRREHAESSRVHVASGEQLPVLVHDLTRDDDSEETGVVHKEFGNAKGDVENMDEFYRHVSCCEYRPFKCQFETCLWVDAFCRYEEHCKLRHATSINSVPLPVGILPAAASVYSGVSSLLKPRGTVYEFTHAIKLPVATVKTIIEDCHFDTLKALTAAGSGSMSRRRHYADVLPHGAGPYVGSASCSSIFGLPSALYEFEEISEIFSESIRESLHSPTVASMVESAMRSLRSAGLGPPTAGSSSSASMAMLSSANSSEELDKLTKAMSLMASVISKRQQSAAASSRPSARCSTSPSSASSISRGIGDLMWPKIYRFRDDMHFFVLTRLMKGRLYVIVRVNHLKPIVSVKQLQQIDAYVSSHVSAYRTFSENKGYCPRTGRNAGRIAHTTMQMHGSFDHLPKEMQCLLAMLTSATNPQRADDAFKVTFPLHPRVEKDAYKRMDHMSAAASASAASSSGRSGRLVEASDGHYGGARNLWRSTVPSYTAIAAPTTAVPSHSSGTGTIHAMVARSQLASKKKKKPPRRVVCAPLTYSRVKSMASLASVGTYNVQVLVKDKMAQANARLKPLATDESELFCCDLPFDFEKNTGQVFVISPYKLARSWQMKDRSGRSLDFESGEARAIKLSQVTSAVVRFHFVADFHDSSNTAMAQSVAAFTRKPQVIECINIE